MADKEETTSKPPAKRERAKSPPGQAKKVGMPFEKKLCWGGLILSGLLAATFALDMFSGFPFRQASIPLDVLVVIACGLLVYLAIDTLRELR